MAVAEASFKTLNDSISSGFNAPSTFDIPTPASSDVVTPSITIKGELLADREEPLRMRMVVPDPGCPSPGTISKPGTFPVSIS